jgi:hypothetical protein
MNLRNAWFELSSDVGYGRHRPNCERSLPIGNNIGVCQHARSPKLPQAKRTLSAGSEVRLSSFQRGRSPRSFPYGFVAFQAGLDLSFGQSRAAASWLNCLLSSGAILSRRFDKRWLLF